MKRFLLGMLMLGISTPVLSQIVTPETLIPHFEGLAGRAAVSAITPYGEGFVVAGHFSGTSSLAAKNLLHWDGTQWKGFDLFPGENVRDMVVYQGDLWIGGPYGGLRDADGKNFPGEYNRITRWNGSEWLESNQGIGGVPDHFVVWGDRLLAFGAFTHENIRVYAAEWDGTVWQPLDGQPNGEVHDAVVWDGHLYVVGDFHGIGGSSALRVARHNGVSWEDVGYPSGQTPSAVTVHDGQLYVGGDWPLDGGGWNSHLIRFDGSAWNEVAALPHAVVHLASHGGRLYAGHRDEGKSPYQPDKLAAYDNGSLSWESEWLDHLVADVTVVGGQLLVAGAFAQVGGQWAGGLAAAGQSGLALFEGDEIVRQEAEIRAAVARGGDLYIGGDFVRLGDRYLSNVAYWDGAELRPMGGGFVDPVYFLEVFQGNVLAGGRFIANNQRSAIKAWNGAQWEAVPDTPGGTLEALTATDDYVYAGGSLSFMGNRNLMRWDGDSWDHSLGSPDNTVYGVTLHEGGIVASGTFKNIGTTPVNYICVWEDGQWTDIGQGLDDFVRESFSIGDTLYITGNFSTEGSPSIYSAAKRTSGGWERMRGNVIGLIYDMTTIDDVVFMSGTLVYEGQYSGWAGKVVSRWNGSDWVPVSSGLAGEVHKMVGYNGGTWIFGDLTDHGTPHVAFQYQLLDLPGDFELISPINGAAVDSLTPTFHWAASSNATQYLIQVYDNPGFAHPPVASEFSDRPRSKPLVSLEPSRTYHWRVRAISNAGETPWRTGSFSTSATAVNLEEDIHIPRELALHPAFPNPFNPAATIHFDLPQASWVNITVYDVLGRPVAVLLDADRGWGRHRLTVDATRWASGLYFVRMRVGNEVFMQKMTLAK